MTSSTMRKVYATLGGAWLSIAGTSIAQTPSPYGEESHAELARGPLHEAFAQPYELMARAELLIPIQPPELIDELPPEVAFEGENVQWIPGYWAWDVEISNFIWVSGFWRDIPPGKVWTPGYWAEVTGGWQWIVGYWENEEVEEISYLPYPPSELRKRPKQPSTS
jgi:hypothetical protein